jgi:uncharacterized protein
MSDDVYRAALRRIAEYCRDHGQDSISIVFHGGEPTLLGVGKLRQWCQEAAEALEGLQVSFAIQTNGTLIDSEWVNFFSDWKFNVGMSVDGSESVHDRQRVDHKGVGSYSRVAASARLLAASDVSFGILSVVQLGEDPLECHRSLVALGCKSLGYMMPHYTHDTIGPIRSQYGPTPCADFLLPILEEWFTTDCDRVRIREFWNIGRLIMGGRSRTDVFGNDPLGYLFVETDGQIEGLDILRICGDDSYKTGLNVLDSGFADVVKRSDLNRMLLEGTLPLPTSCTDCPESSTCAGGYAPHRFSLARGFDNSSVWCADIIKIFSCMREYLGVSHDETEELRKKLAHTHDVKTSGKTIV